ncbi:winged helix-turn-helix domain-containing protein [bacterium]|nr:winged helix-turn-helix domain-containing protein [bacterium]
MKKAIHEVAAEILSEHKKPMSADEIYEVIASRGLYEFKAKSPQSVLRSQLRRHSANVSGPNQAKDQKFNMSVDGQFSLI